MVNAGLCGCAATSEGLNTDSVGFTIWGGLEGLAGTVCCTRREGQRGSSGSPRDREVIATQGAEMHLEQAHHTIVEFCLGKSWIQAKLEDENALY